MHTQHVPKLGPIEWIMVTPSNHRVHHARNDQYVDKNYGVVFIIWDRLFGTFQDELAEEPAVYGLRKPLNSWNPLWANTHVYWRLLIDFVKMKGIKNKVQLLFKPPGWLPADYTKTCKAAAPVDLKSKYHLKSKYDLKSNTYVTLKLYATSIATSICPKKDLHSVCEICLVHLQDFSTFSYNIMSYFLKCPIYSTICAHFS